MIPETIRALKDAIDVVLFENTVFQGREQLQYARQLLDDEVGIELCDDHINAAVQRIMRPLRLTDDMRQYIMQTTLLPDVSQRG